MDVTSTSFNRIQYLSCPFPPFDILSSRPSVFISFIQFVYRSKERANFYHIAFPGNILFLLHLFLDFPHRCSHGDREFHSLSADAYGGNKLEKLIGTLVQKLLDIVTNGNSIPFPLTWNRENWQNPLDLQLSNEKFSHYNMYYPLETIYGAICFSCGKSCIICDVIEWIGLWRNCFEKINLKN